MTLSGYSWYNEDRPEICVLIPILMDDPLWVCLMGIRVHDGIIVLIPILMDDPLWAVEKGQQH